MLESHNPKILLAITKDYVKWEKNTCIPPITHDNNILQILAKMPNSLILFLENSAQLLQITVASPHSLIPLPISTWQTSN